MEGLLSVWASGFALWLFLGLFGGLCTIFDANSKEGVRYGLNMCKKAAATSLIWPAAGLYLCYKGIMDWYKGLPEGK